MNLHEQLLRRYATKQFDTEKKIPEQDLNLLIESLRLSPSSFGLEPWKFIVLSNQDTQNSLIEYSWGQKHVAEASHVIVLCAKDEITTEDVSNHIASIAKTRGVELSSLDNYKGMMLGRHQNTTPERRRTRAEKQVYIAQGFLLSAAAQLGIDACPMEGFSSKDYDKLLGLEGTGYHSVITVPVGYRSPSDKYATAAKVRKNASEVIDMR